jgi:hypothetical protein
VWWVLVVDDEGIVAVDDTLVGGVAGEVGDPLVVVVGIVVDDGVAVEVGDTLVVDDTVSEQRWCISSRPSQAART